MDDADLNYWLRPRTLSRRRVLRGGAYLSAGLAGAALIGCRSEPPAAAPSAGSTAPPAVSPAAASETPVSVAEPVRGGTYRAGMTGAFAGVDPHSSVYGGATVVPLVHAYLFRKEVLRPDLGLKRDLSTEHSLRPDQVTWTFTLRDDVRIAPNTEGIPERALDAEDVVASFRRMADQSSGANAYPFFAGWVDRFDAPDPRTVRLVTKRPYAWVEEVFGDTLRGAIVPRELLERGKDVLKTTAVGAGPFTLERLEEGKGATFGRNPNFYDPALPRVETFNLITYQDQATYRTAFAADQLDVYYAQNREEAQELARTVRGTQHLEVQSTGFNSFWMRTDVSPWDDGRVRRAMNLSMDRDQYIALIGKGQGWPAGPVPPVFGDYALPADELARLQPFDAAEAAKLFAAAGVSEVEFAFPTSSNMPDYVEIMAQQLSQAGVTARPEALNAGAWLGEYFGSKLSASYSLNQSYKTPDVALGWHRTGGFSGNNAYDTKWTRPEVDEAIDRAAGIFDPAERAEAYREAQRLILAADPAFINVFQIGGNPVVRNRVRDFDVGPGAMSNFMLRYFWLDTSA